VSLVGVGLIERRFQGVNYTPDTMLKFFNKDECENHYKFGKTLGQGR